jgi:hypothetical protein
MIDAESKLKVSSFTPETEAFGSNREDRGTSPRHSERSETDSILHSEAAESDSNFTEASKKQREPKGPLWQRLPKALKTLISRLLAALGCFWMAWLGLSAIIYLGQPVDQAANLLANTTSAPIYAQTEMSFIIRLVLSVVIALVGFLVPSIGSAVAILALSAGFFFTGNWIIGLIVLAGSIAWWMTMDGVQLQMQPSSHLHHYLSGFR